MSLCFAKHQCNMQQDIIHCVFICLHFFKMIVHHLCHKEPWESAALKTILTKLYTDWNVLVFRLPTVDLFGFIYHFYLSYFSYKVFGTKVLCRTLIYSSNRIFNTIVSRYFQSDVKNMSAINYQHFFFLPMSTKNIIGLLHLYL